ncbi:MAG: DUF1670 domain-containing protein [Proteobacteria bacterium]|nr:DUF1670 domain-containing protein [Pseudomonadota bacterium]
MSSHSDRYKTINKRTFASAMEHLLETEFKLVGSHRVIRMMVESIMELHQEFFPETSHLTPGTILWATTKAGEGAKVSWGKRAEEYGIKLVHLPLVTKTEIESRQNPGRGNNPKNNRQKQAQRDMHTMARLVKSAAEQGGLLTGAEVSVLMNRSLGKVQQYIRDWESETGEALPMKGYVLDMGSSPTHKGIICRKFEEGMSPPDIARATGHTLQAVDNYLGTYERIKVLLLRGFDVPTISQVTGKALRTIAQYLVIVECYQPDLLQASHHQWMIDRRKGKSLVTPPETLVAMTESLENPDPSDKKKCDKIVGGHSQKMSSKKKVSKMPQSRSSKG